MVLDRKIIGFNPKVLVLWMGLVTAGVSFAQTDKDTVRWDAPKLDALINALGTSDKKAATEAARVVLKELRKNQSDMDERTILAMTMTRTTASPRGVR